MYQGITLSLSNGRMTMFGGDEAFFGTQDRQLPPASSHGDVNYSCGSCGYELNLNSCSRNTSAIGSKYGKSIRRGIISFFSIDESRFILIDGLRFVPYIASKRSWGLFRRRTKLLCRKCRNHIGNAYKQSDSFSSQRLGGADFVSWDGISGQRTYHIKISALQPSSLQNSADLSIMAVDNYS